MFGLNKHYLLLFMMKCYIIPYYYIYSHFKNNFTISNVLNNHLNKNILFFDLFLLSISTILYEIIYRKDFYSLIFIFLLLLSIFPVIIINENNIFHYIFAFQVFISILCFMTRNCFLSKNYTLLFISLFSEYWLFFSIALNINKNKNIFYSEFYFIINFAFYYLYLHFIS